MQHLFDWDMLKGLVILLNAAIMTAFAVNHFSPRGIALTGQWDADGGTVVTARAKNDVVVTERELNDITVVKDIFDNKAALFVDARSSEAYTEGHIPGALSLPVNDFFDRINQFMTDYPEETKIVAYCTGRLCHDSHRLATDLEDAGYMNVHVFIDGIEGWQEKGYPLDS